MIEYFPPLDADRRAVSLPIVEVTVLEDRAVVRRQGPVVLEAGLNRLRIEDVAPVLQDVSLRAEGSAGRVTDTRVRRATRVRRQDRPAAVAEIEARLRELGQAFEDASDTRDRAEERFETVWNMLQLGATEIPGDAAWGIVDPESWAQTFSSLFTRGRELRNTALQALHTQQDVKRDHDQVARQRRLLDTPAVDFMAWAQVDVSGEAGEITLTLEYVVPNALWRPLHRARLVADQLTFTARAAVWQNTGEDWEGVKLVLSTARASLGTEPPLLSDDLLRAQRRSDDVVVAAREVAVNTASVGGTPPNEVELPGVDDGGEVQNLRPDGSADVPSHGRPVVLDVFGFTGAAETRLVCMPEVQERVFLKCIGTHGGTSPVLAGPVELVRDNGTVGWTEVLYIAPGAPFELGFGPQDHVRISRSQRVISDKHDPVDKWKRRVTQLHLYLSNLGDQARTLHLTERVPVSEIEHVKVSLVDERTTGSPSLDEHGFVTWTVDLAAHQRHRLKLGWQLALAPDVKGEV